jgi:hypothetical protein
MAVAATDMFHYFHQKYHINRPHINNARQNKSAYHTPVKKFTSGLASITYLSPNNDKITETILTALATHIFGHSRQSFII